MIDFTKQDLTNFKNGSGVVKAEIFEDENNKIMKLKLDKGVSLGLHTHIDTSEIIYIIEGEAHFIIDGKNEYLKVNDVHYCPQCSSHAVINEKNETLVLFAVVSKH